jgi:formylmethanofuran dehydrogenase subunit E
VLRRASLLFPLTFALALLACDREPHGAQGHGAPSGDGHGHGAPPGNAHGHGAPPGNAHGHSAHPQGSPGHGAHAPPAGSADPLAEVARVHGGAGPWAVAGYRMGQAALQKLGLARQSFDLDVTHRGPLEPQYACVADGASAATGASLGKVNLRLEAAPADGVVTVYKKKSTGQSVALRPTEAFRKRFLDVPREELGRAGAQVLALKDEEIFEEVAGQVKKVPGQVNKDPLNER